MKGYLTSRNRGISVALLFVVTCAAAARPSQEPGSPTWPREIESAGGKLRVYEPQLDTLKGTRVAFRAALSLHREASAEPVFGGFWMEGTLSAGADRRTATLTDVRITELRFPSATTTETIRLRGELAAEIGRWNLVYSMDALLAELKQVEERRALAQGLKADVPEIHFRSHPAVLLSIQGEPAWREIPDRPFRRLENASLFVLQDEAGTAYLQVPPFWWTAKNPLGPWEPADDVPDQVREIGDAEPRPAAEPGRETIRRPDVIVATGPAELIWTDGLPRYAPIDGTELLYVTNTDSDVFLHIPTQDTYVLLSGRWYRTPSTKVAWEFVPSDRLPADFARIPLSSEKQHVLACVAGTRQAREAVLDAEIPQTEAVTPGPAPDVEATYDGEPQFQEISGSPVYYAANSPGAVFRVHQRYYYCRGGIWYDSNWAVGPWSVCTYVPPSIYLIPPSCPYYYVTYCRLFSVSPYSVWYGYYPGYRACYTWGGSVVYGTGWNYGWWYGTYCYPRPVTWGYCARYTPLSYGWSARVGTCGTSAWGVYRPSSGYRNAVQAGAGGWWGSTSVRRSAAEVYRAPTSPAATPTLYAKQPERLAPVPDRPRRRAAPVEPELKPRPEPPAARREAPRREEPPRTVPVPPSRENRTPDREPPSRERREEGPRTIPPVERREEDPRSSPPPPPRREESSRTPPAPRERREETPPAPPPRERREEDPRNSPPPTPPPRERREEGPRNPPPPPPRREEGPRNPPPPPPRREEGPRNPPPPPPPRRDEGPRNPPPPPPPRRDEGPRNPPPRREESDRRRAAPEAPTGSQIPRSRTAS